MEGHVHLNIYKQREFLKGAPKTTFKFQNHNGKLLPYK